MASKTRSRRCGDTFPCKCITLRKAGEREGTDSLGSAKLVANRLIHIARSPLSGYFYGLPDELEALAQALGEDSYDLRHKTVGEVAYRIKLAQMKERRGDADISAGRAHDSLRAFAEPVYQLSLCLDGLMDPRPSKEFRKKEAADSLQDLLEPELPQLRAQDVEQGDYFSQHFNAQHHSSPHVRLGNSFLFQTNEYIEAVDLITGWPGQLKKLLQPFDDNRCTLYALIRILVRTMEGKPDHGGEKQQTLRSFKKKPNRKLVEEAHWALHGLLIAPFSCVHFGNLSIEEQMELQELMAELAMDAPPKPKKTVTAASDEELMEELEKILDGLWDADESDEDDKEGGSDD